MKARPNRPPDISTPISLPTPRGLSLLKNIAITHSDPDVRMLATAVVELSTTVDAIANALPGIARGDFVSLDEPDVEQERVE